VGAAVNVAANYFLIPSMGMAGAAWATLLAYCAMAVMLYFIVQRVYPIRYEWERIMKIALSLSTVWLLYLLLHQFTPSFSLHVVTKCMLTACFFGLIYMMKF